VTDVVSAIAISPSGHTLVDRAEGTGGQRGGNLAWHVFDKSGKATDQPGRALRGIPVWRPPTAMATPEGFVIIRGSPGRIPRRLRSARACGSPQGCDSLPPRAERCHPGPYVPKPWMSPFPQPIG
jgi:hypothetical protein